MAHGPRVAGSSALCGGALGRMWVAHGFRVGGTGLVRGLYGWIMGLIWVAHGPHVGGTDLMWGSCGRIRNSCELMAHWEFMGSLTELRGTHGEFIGAHWELAGTHREFMMSSWGDSEKIAKNA